MATAPPAPAGTEDDAIRRTIDSLAQSGALDELQTTFLRDRWMGQLQWFERKAARNQTEMNRYRVILLAGGVVLPVLVNLAAIRSEGWIQAGAVVVSLVVGFVAGLEVFRRPGERWLRFRQTAEQLRAEWWLYVNLAGPDYERFGSVSDAYRHFVVRVQTLISEDVAGFVAIVRSAAEAGTEETPAALGSPPGP